MATQEEKKSHEQEWTFEAEVDMPVCVLHRNWRSVDPLTGELYIPADRLSWFDKIAFTGGIGYNVPYETAKKWLQAGLIDRNMIFPNDATEADFEARTGRYAISRNFGTSATDFEPEKVAALLGAKSAEQFAHALLKHVEKHKSGSR